LSTSLHAEWAMRAAARGKHVLCEKPLALGRAVAHAMFSAARHHGVMLLEAFPYYFQPQTGAMLAALREGAIGTVRMVQASFGFNLGRPVGNIRLAPELGGGALLDAGSYPLSLIRLVMGCAPVRVVADARWHSPGVDIGTVATLHYADGRQAQLSCAMDTALHRHAILIGSDGVLETDFLNHTSAPGEPHPHGYLPGQLRLRRGLGNSAFVDLPAGAGSGFRFAAEAFAKVVTDGDFAAIERAALASLDNAAKLEALALSARLGQPVDLAPLPA
jgi:predicted dehydrogenase